jgi:hypothetical protein
MSRPADPGLPCGADLAALVAQVADGVRPGPEQAAHQASCPHCGLALAELGRIWELAGELAAERVIAPAHVQDVIMQRVRRAVFLGQVAELFEGLLPRIGRALLVYTGVLRNP